MLRALIQPERGRSRISTSLPLQATKTRWSRSLVCNIVFEVCEGCASTLGPKCACPECCFRLRRVSARPNAGGLALHQFGTSEIAPDCLLTKVRPRNG